MIKGIPEGESIIDIQVKEAIRLAQADKAKNPLKFGSTIAHPGDNKIYALDSIDTEEQTVRANYRDKDTGELIVKTFSYEEVFNPNRARDLMAQAWVNILRGPNPDPDHVIEVFKL